MGLGLDLEEIQMSWRDSSVKSRRGQADDFDNAHRRRGQGILMDVDQRIAPHQFPAVDATSILAHQCW